MPYVNNFNAIKEKSEDNEHFTLIMVILIAVFLFFATMAYFATKFCTKVRNKAVAPLYYRKLIEFNYNYQRKRNYHHERSFDNQKY